MRSTIVAAALLSLTAGCRSHTPRRVAPLEAARLEPHALQRVVDDAVDHASVEFRFVGLTVAVAVPGQPLFVKGYGFADLEHRVAATPDTVYCVGSISKSFAAAAIMQQVEAGAIRLDAPITDYLPDYPVPADRPITVHDLLHHSSGIPDYEYEGAWPGSKALPRSQDDVVALFRDQPLQFEPGSRFVYSSSGYYLLAPILERVTGMSWAIYLQQHVFERAGMETVRVCEHSPIIEHRATGHAFDSGQPRRAELVDLAQFGPAGGLCMTATDLVRWTQALFAGKVVNTSAVERMTTRIPMPDGTPSHYGYGWFDVEFRGHRIVAHTGHVPGFTSQLRYYPKEQIVVVVLANADTRAPSAVLDELTERLLSLPPVRRDVLPPGRVDELVGTYEGPVGAFRIEPVAPQTGALLVIRNQRTPLWWQGDDVFLDGDGAFEVRVLRDASGAVRGILTTNDGMTWWWKRSERTPTPAPTPTPTNR